MRHVPDAERRARLARRHAIAPWARVDTPEAATRAMTVLHATEPASVYLSLLARVDPLSVADVDRVLYEERTLVKQLAMRRTLFVFTRDLLGAALGSASARVAGPHAVRIAKDVQAGGLAPDGEAWLAAARAAVLAALADGSERGARALREALPELQGAVSAGSGKWGGPTPVGPRVLTQLGVEGLITRGSNGGHWRTSRPQWTLMEAWLGEVPTPLAAEDGYRELVRRWLRTFGPGTAEDLRWWLGGTLTVVRAALASLEAVEVSLDGGGAGWLLPDDLDPEEPADEWVALLPVLDPTVMGWKERGFYLGGYAPQLFDTAGNAGTTAWWDGRVVGCWVQDEAGVVEVRLLEPVPARVRGLLAVEAERLTAWLDGTRVGTVYPSSAMRAVEWVHP